MANAVGTIAQNKRQREKRNKTADFTSVLSLPVLTVFPQGQPATEDITARLCTPLSEDNVFLCFVHAIEAAEN